MMSGGVKGKTFFTKDSATIKIQKWIRRIQAKKKALEEIEVYKKNNGIQDRPATRANRGPDVSTPEIDHDMDEDNLK